MSRRCAIIDIDSKMLLALELLAPADEAYGLDLIRRSGSVLKRGTIYVTLDRMETQGLIESRPESAPKYAGGIPRRLYRMTELGRGALALARGDGKVP